MKRIKPDQRPRLLARFEALTECADHLDQDWTEDPLEREEGKRISKHLRVLADAALRRAEYTPTTGEKP